MSKLAIIKQFGSRFESDQYIVDINRPDEDAGENALRCHTCPFFDIPIRLDIAIRKDGTIAFLGWKWCGNGTNTYLHTDAISQKALDEMPEGMKLIMKHHVHIPTLDQIDTVNGLFSGRIRFEGLKLSPGASLQHICPIDVAREESLIGKKMYLC